MAAPLEQAQSQTQFSQAQPIDIRQSRGFSDQLTLTFDFFRQNFRQLGKSLLHIVGPLIVLAFLGRSISLFFFFQKYVQGTYDYMATESPMHVVTDNIGLVAVVFVSIIVVGTMMSCVINSYVQLYVQNGGVAPDVRQVWDTTRPLRWRGYFTVLGLVIFMVAAFVLSLALMSIGSLAPLLVLPVFMIAGIYWMVVLSPVMPVALQENRRLASAMGRCRELVRGNWWLTFKLLAVVTGISLVLMLILRMPSFLIMMFYPLNFETDPSLIPVYSLISAIDDLALYLSLLLPSLALALHYFNLVEKLEGVGALERIEQLGEENILKISA